MADRFIDEPAGTIPEGGRFGSDTYERARAFLRSNEAAPSTAAPAAPKAAPVVSSRPKSTPMARPSTGTPAGTGAAMRRAASVGTPAGTGAAMRNTDARAERIDAAMQGIREAGTYSDTPAPGRPVFVPVMGGGRALEAVPRALQGMKQAARLGGPSTARSAGLSGPAPAPAMPRVGTNPPAPRLGRNTPPPAASKPPMSRAEISPRSRTRFNQDESGMEFRNGGMVKSTPKSTKYACGGPVKKA